MEPGEGEVRIGAIRGPARDLRIRPLFVSSTFRDMHAERDYLREFVFPAVEEAARARGRRVSIEPIDLRVGVETLSEAEAAAKEILVLRVCLDEIERSRPFLIALLGDRFGWVPEAERMRLAAARAGLDPETCLGASVTALEIRFGALRDGATHGRCRFYFREPLPYDRMPRDVAARFSDERAGRREAAEGLARLKADLRARYPDRCREYRAGWDAARGRVCGLEGFGALVTADLLTDLEEDVVAEPSPRTWQEEERLALAEFVERKRIGFAGRAEVIDRMVRNPEKGGAPGRILVGPPGSGKSALFAMAVAALREDPATLVFAHASGASPRANDIESMIRRWGEEAALAGSGTSTTVYQGGTRQDVERALARDVRRLAESRPVALLIDAIERFDQPHWGWLPDPLPPRVHLVATGLPGPAAEDLLGRVGFERLDVPPISRREADDIISGVLARHHRRFSSNVHRALIGKNSPEGVPSFTNPLWLVTAAEEINRLDEEDFERMEGVPGGSAEERIDRLLVGIAESLPGDVPGLYSAMLGRLESAHGDLLTAGLACALGVGRVGWRARDFQALVPAVASVLDPHARTEPCDELRVANLRRGFRVHLNVHGPHGTLDFAHQQMRAAVLTRYLESPGTGDDVHAAVANHLLSLPKEDPLRQSETLHHLFAVGDLSRAAAWLTEATLPGEIEGASNVFRPLFRPESAAGVAPGVARVDALLQATSSNAQARDSLVTCLVNVVLVGLESETSIASRVTVAGALIRAANEIPAGDTGPSSRWALATSHVVAGWARSERGEPDAAGRHFAGALEALEKCLPPALPEEEWLLTACNAVKGLGDMLASQGRSDDALHAYRGFLKFLEPCSNTPAVRFRQSREACVLHARIGEVLLRKGAAAEALAAYERSLAIARELEAEDPGDRKRLADVAVSWEKVGDAHRRLDQDAATREAYVESLRIRRLLMSAHPRDPEVCASFVVGLYKHAMIGGESRLLPDGTEDARKAVEVCRRWLAEDPESIPWSQFLAQALMCLGQVERSAGREREAMVAFREAHQRYDADRARVTTSMIPWLGSVTALRLIQEGEGEEPTPAKMARARMRVDLAREAVDRFADSDELAAELAQARGDLVGLLRTAGDAAAGIDMAYQAAAEAQRRVRKRPSDRRAILASGEAGRWLADLLLEAGRLGEAAKRAAAACEALERVRAGRPDDSYVLHQVSLAHNVHGEACRLGKRFDVALREHVASRDALRRACELDPENRQLRHNWATAWQKVGDVRLQAGVLEAARAAYEGFLTLSEEMLSGQADDLTAARGCSIAHDRLASISLLEGDLPAECRHLQESIRFARTSGATSTVEATAELAALLERLAAVQGRAGERGAAVASWEEAERSASPGGSGSADARPRETSGQANRPEARTPAEPSRTGMAPPVEPPSRLHVSLCAELACPHCLCTSPKAGVREDAIGKELEVALVRCAVCGAPALMHILPQGAAFVLPGFYGPGASGEEESEAGGKKRGALRLAPQVTSERSARKAAERGGRQYGEGDFRGASQSWQSALEWYERTEGAEETVRALRSNLATAACSLGEYSAAIAALAPLVERLDVASEPDLAATILNNLAAAYLRSGDAVRGVEFHERAVAVHFAHTTSPETRERDIRNLAFALRVRCADRFLEGDAAGALHALESAVALLQRAGLAPADEDTALDAARRMSIARLSAKQQIEAERPEEASRALRSVLDKVADDLPTSLRREALGDLARALRTAGRFGEALACHGEIVGMDETADATPPMPHKRRK